jgi:hypothetical protein
MLALESTGAASASRRRANAEPSPFFLFPFAAFDRLTVKS